MCSQAKEKKKTVENLKEKGETRAQETERDKNKKRYQGGTLKRKYTDNRRMNRAWWFTANSLSLPMKK